MLVEIGTKAQADDGGRVAVDDGVDPRRALLLLAAPKCLRRKRKYAPSLS